MIKMIEFKLHFSKFKCSIAGFGMCYFLTSSNKDVIVSMVEFIPQRIEVHEIKSGGGCLQVYDYQIHEWTEEIIQQRSTVNY